MVSGGMVRLFSHSFIKSVAVRLMLPGARRVSADQAMSLAFFAEGDDGDEAPSLFLKQLKLEILLLLLLLPP